MRTFALLAAIAVADKSDFPHDDSFHADCHVTADFEEYTCNQLYNVMATLIQKWDSPETSPAQGTYTYKEDGANDYIWSTRLTKNGKYTDDQIFEFTTTENGCSVAGHSRSQSVSILDNSVNFCNLWNVYNGTGIAFTQSVGKCAAKADEPVTTCARYADDSSFALIEQI